MSLIGNILWIILGGGLPIALGYIASGLTMCVTIIGIPFGIQSIKLGILTLLPFGREANPTPEHGSTFYTILNIIWFILFGVWIALTHLGFAIVCAITVIGLPFAVQHMKLVSFSFSPFGREIS
ncbi:YccF domain-containing protein [bacterium]|jgi:uncharacterized membrane protein YccF (DUF307 family)|nr:YccF domain-containing protein [bacterium]